jgi:hypothetical protein
MDERVFGMPRRAASLVIEHCRTKNDLEDRTGIRRGRPGRAP